MKARQSTELSPGKITPHWSFDYTNVKAAIQDEEIMTLCFLKKTLTQTFKEIQTELTVYGSDAQQCYTSGNNQDFFLKIKPHFGLVFHNQKKLWFLAR